MLSAVLEACDICYNDEAGLTILMMVQSSKIFEKVCYFGSSVVALWKVSCLHTSPRLVRSTKVRSPAECGVFRSFLQLRHALAGRLEHSLGKTPCLSLDVRLYNNPPTTLRIYGSIIVGRPTVPLVLRATLGSSSSHAGSGSTPYFSQMPQNK